MINGVHTLNVLTEVAEERHRQDERWGQQDHPVHGTLDQDDGIPVLGGLTYEEAEHQLKWAFSQGERSGAVILLEEVMEALAARGVRAQRTELIQVAAVAVMMVEAIDRASQGVPLADMVSRVAPDIQLTADQKRVLDATVELRLEPIPLLKDAGPLETSSDWAGPMDTFELWDGTEIRTDHAPPDGIYTTGVYDEADPLPPLTRLADGLGIPEPEAFRQELDDGPPVASLRHPWGGEGRLHGICRCGEGRDFWAHQCADCEHGAHPGRPCTAVGVEGIGECDCGE